MDISALNLLTTEKATRMPYTPDSRKRSVEVFFAGDGGIVIFGLAEHYIYWVSESKADDIETNRQIFAQLAQAEPSCYTYDHIAKGLTKYGYDNMMHFYSAILTSADEILPYQKKITDSRRMREPDSPYSDLMQYNLLTPENAAAPKYMPQTGDYLIRVYYADNDEIIIEGVADNNFTRWLSVTKISDTETNRRIFAFLSETVAVEFGHFNLLLRETHYTYEQTKFFYSAELTRAEDIIPQLEQAKERCRKREADSKFMQQLRAYKKKLAYVGKDPVKNYKRKRGLIEKIEGWSYLRCSDRAETRALYNKLVQLGSEQYNAYMTETH